MPPHVLKKSHAKQVKAGLRRLTVSQINELAGEAVKHLYPAEFLLARGLNARRLKARRITCSYLKELGYKLSHFIRLGYPVEDILSAGYDAEDFRSHGIKLEKTSIGVERLLVLRFSLRELVDAGYGMRELQPFFRPQDFRMHFTLRELIQHGFSGRDLLAADYSQQEINSAFAKWGNRKKR